jgi:hypothetical protein
MDAWLEIFMGSVAHIAVIQVLVNTLPEVK